MRPLRLGQIALVALVAAAAIAAPGCIAGPKYVRPVVQAPAAYNELGGDLSAGTDAWKPAQPSDAAARGQWWTIFNDPTLDRVPDSIERVYHLEQRGAARRAEGYLIGRTLMSYIHLHFASNHDLPRSFVAACAERSAPS